MLRLRALDEALACRDRTAGCCVSIGFFDGLHLGHQHLLRSLRDWASSAQEATTGPAVVVTFDRHPLEVLGRTAPLRILSSEHRFRLLEHYGVDAVLELPFTTELASWSADTFVERVLRDALGARGLLMGFDSAFGRDRGGTFESLHSRQEQLQIEVRRGTVAQLGTERVSSTLVRRAVTDGDLPRLRQLLDRPFSLLGVVVPGDGRGRQLGIPTANLDVEGAAPLPPGVYFAYAHLQDAVHGALVNIGVRPTFTEGSEPPLVIEAHLLDFDGDLYGRHLELEFLKHHRDEMRFASVDDLLARIHDDRRAFLAEVPPNAGSRERDS